MEEHVPDEIEPIISPRKEKEARPRQESDGAFFFTSEGLFGPVARSDSYWAFFFANLRSLVS